MTVHCLHIFDHKGKTLFTKTYSVSARKQQNQIVGANSESDPNTELDEQRKLVFGMLFSLREIMGSLDPNEVSCKFDCMCSSYLCMNKFMIMNNTTLCNFIPLFFIIDSEIFEPIITSIKCHRNRNNNSP